MEKIKRVAFLANYYAEKHYLGKSNSSLDLELNTLAKEDIEFTVYASTHDRDHAKNLAFNHAWQHPSGLRY